MRSIPLADNKDRQDSELRKVVLGSSLGTAFEWYDFFIFATLATTMGPLFFSKSLGETATFLASIATYGAGLILRPFGSLLFGRMGDLIGRKKTFMLTMSLMGVSTASIGLLPTYDMAGIAAPILLVTLRCIQGLALGGGIWRSRHLCRRARRDWQARLCHQLDTNLRHIRFSAFAHGGLTLSNRAQ